MKPRPVSYARLNVASPTAHEPPGGFKPAGVSAHHVRPAVVGVSLLDRLLHHNNVVATDGESYRMREARARSGGRPSKP